MAEQLEGNYSLHEENASHKVCDSSIMYAPNNRQVLTGYQMQILDSIANVHDESELKEIRNLISEYFSNKALDAMDRLCNEGKLSTATVESWHSEHLRTPYFGYYVEIG